MGSVPSGEVGAGEVGVAGEGFAGLAVDEEADLVDGGEVGVERRDDREQGEGFGLDAGGVVFGEGAGEVDDRGLAPGLQARGWPLSLAGRGHEEDFVDSGAAGQWVLRAWRGVVREELARERGRERRSLWAGQVRG